MMGKPLGKKASWEQNLERVMVTIFSGGVILLLALAWVMADNYIVQPDSYRAGVREATEVTYQIGDAPPTAIVLPARIHGIEFHTPITLRTTIGPTDSCSIRVETI
jgi:hypothetical protein